MLILIANPGSTSYKCKLFETDGMDVLFQATVERIGDQAGIVTVQFHDAEAITTHLPIADYQQAIQQTLTALETRYALQDLAAVGFKVVLAKGFNGCVEVTKALLEGMREYRPLAPVHTDVYLTAIIEFQKLLPQTRMMALLETAFHANMSAEKYLYGIPYRYYQTHGIRKYGFHGASHRYISQRVCELYNEAPNDCRIISCHLGGSSSVCAIKNGQSIDTSMGMSPQSGLLNAKRVGDFDSFALLYLMEREKLSIDQAREVLTNEGGVLGISNISGDNRDIEEAMHRGNEQAHAAFMAFAYYTKRYIGEYLAALNGADYIVFTAGLGQNSPLMRQTILSDMENLGIELDDVKNKENPEEGLISSTLSHIKIAVIPTNEEQVVVSEIVKSLT